MSNVAGKSYGMNVITPLRWWTALWQLFAFKLTTLRAKSLLKGLITLSLIHYARWTIIGRNSFPHLDKTQPKEKLKYSYMLFESNFNGSWDQYIDSFAFAIPSGLDSFWQWNIKYPKSIPLHDFYNYIRFNQVECNHYYNAYPLAASNDVKSAISLYVGLKNFEKNTQYISNDDFLKAYNQFIALHQNSLGSMGESPLMSVSHEKVQLNQAENLIMARHIEQENA